MTSAVKERLTGMLNRAGTILGLVLAAVLVALYPFSGPPSHTRAQTGPSATFYGSTRITDGTQFIPFPIALVNGALAVQQPTIAVTTLSAANTAVTLTLPADGAGLFHYIVAIKAFRTCTTALAGTALLGYTSTNLPGSLAWTGGNACAVGSNNVDIDHELSQPVKSSVANTATTIVAPAGGAAVQIRLTAYYYTAP